MEEAEYFLGTVGKEIHDDRIVGKMESGILDIQCLNEARPYVELVQEALPAVCGTVPAPAHVALRAA